MSLLVCTKCQRTIDTDFTAVDDTDAPICDLCLVIIDPLDPPVVEHPEITLSATHR